MGIETRNESVENPEQVEQVREQELGNNEANRRKFYSDPPGIDGDYASEDEISKMSEDKEKKAEAERVEVMSDTNNIESSRDYPETYQEWYDSLAKDQRDTHDGLKSNVKDFIKTTLVHDNF